MEAIDWDKYHRQLSHLPVQTRLSRIKKCLECIGINYGSIRYLSVIRQERIVLKCVLAFNEFLKENAEAPEGSSTKHATDTIKQLRRIVVRILRVDFSE